MKLVNNKKSYPQGYLFGYVKRIYQATDGLTSK